MSGLNTTDLIEQAKPHLQEWTASRIRLGLVFAEVLSSTPQYARATVVRSMGELVIQAGYEPFSWPEAELLARLAREHIKLRDPRAVDLESPAVHALNRELSTIFRCVEQRAYTRQQQGGNA